MRAGIPRTLGTEMEEAPGPVEPGAGSSWSCLATTPAPGVRAGIPRTLGTEMEEAPGPGQSVMTASRRIQAGSCAALCIKAPTSARLMRGIPRIFMLSATR